ncbi:hypothetical protein RUM43_005008 [Polyplax serrata]|uniref:Ig-like domain-containing protein n=1 Tax=Polyplax serrata TaxID=468196 RepID=A0AAN8SBF7_POLSC
MPDGLRMKLPIYKSQLGPRFKEFEHFSLGSLRQLEQRVLCTSNAENTTELWSEKKEDANTLKQLEMELIRQPQKRGNSEKEKQRGWSSWSPWSTCSRLCDGGVSYQMRRCRVSGGCHGEAMRYKICNMQPCSEPIDFREHQCAAYNDSPYDDQYLRWSAHYDENEPCALTCRGSPVEESKKKSGEEPAIIVQLASKVQDGTRCRPGSLDMCVSGKCLRVGCDLRIGSNRRVDECGVCGGDGSSCAQPMYHWEEEPASLCSATCGGGYKMSKAVCKNRLSGEEMDELLCNVSEKPAAKIVECNDAPCSSKWAIHEWGPCSASCGGGVRKREVYCSEEVNLTKIKVHDHRCPGEKPPSEESCEERECPKWVALEWSGCSVSCGEGIQTRTIGCKDGTKPSTIPCNEFDKPTSIQACHSGIRCPERTFSDLKEATSSETKTEEEEEEDEDEEDEEAEEHLKHSIQRPYPPSVPLSGPMPGAMSGPFAATAEKLVGSNLVNPSHPIGATFIPEKWGPCSVTCGEGIRRREVECKIYLELTGAIAGLPDEQCRGPKPSTVERCVLEPCAMNNKLDIAKDRPVSDQYSYSSLPSQKKVKVAPESSGKTYSWKQQGFTHCSASCLGGVQESIINCIRDDDQKVVVPLLCSPETRPESLIRTCNDQPCPPRWNYSDFQPCSKSCGIGIQTRDVNCIHEVTRGGGTTVVVPNSMCPQPPPPDRQYCNVLDCPVRWHTGDWSKCSKRCGGGLKTRTVQCKQVMAQNHIMDRPTSMCPAMKPPDKKPCNTKSCVETDRPVIASAINQTYVQSSAARKKVSLKIGGTAQVFLGTQVKIKCPVKRFDRAKIQWAKDHKYLQQSKKFKISKKGALRINNATYRDSGVYTCLASRSTADITLTVKPMPGHFPNSEEIHQTQNNLENPSYYEPNADSSDVAVGHQKSFLYPGEDDLSHELKPDGIVPPKKTKPRKVKPTSPRPAPKDDSNYINPYEKSWPPYVSTTLVSDQDQSEEFPSRSSGPYPSGPEGSSSSGSSRVMPHFQQLLATLQAFGSSRGHRALVPGHRSLLADHPGPFPIPDSDDTDEQGFATTEDNAEVVLGKGSAQNVKFEWEIKPWNPCSVSCGENGIQTRSVRCLVRLHNATQEVKGDLCEDAGLETPGTFQKCGVDCPTWTHTDWSPCEDSRCFTWNTAMQKREIACAFKNGTEVDAAVCEHREKPTQRQECYNDKCKGTWKVGEWSECAAECEKEGIKYRILQCVWYGTKKPAGNACRDQPRPSVMKICKGPPCVVGRRRLQGPVKVLP